MSFLSFLSRPIPPNHINPPTAPVQKQEAFAGVPCGDAATGTFVVTSDYGWRNIVVDGKSYRQFHDGLDLRSWNCPSKKPQYPGTLYAVESGVVTEVLFPDKEFPSALNPDGSRVAGVPQGRAWTPYIKLQADSGRVWIYRHAKAAVLLKDRLVAGSLIGCTDKNYGFSTGIHLHLELWVDGKNINPLPQLEAFGFRRVEQWA